MAGVTLHAGFDNGPITHHLAMLAIMDSKGYDGVRRDIGEYFVGEVQDNLDGQKLFDGSPMPQSKAAIKRKGKTLIKKHHLYDSYVYQLAGGGVEIGSALVYAAIHHFGGDRAINSRMGPKKPLPARPVLGITERGERKIGDLLIREIQRAQA